MGLLNDLTLQQIFSRIVAFLIVCGLYGLAFAGFARLLGDRTPQYEGRLTANPIAHLQMPALAMAALFQIGWIKPMPLDPAQMRFGRWGPVLAAACALLVTLALVPLLNLLRPIIVVSLPRTAGLTVLAILGTVQSLSIWFFVVNLLPLPVVAGAQLIHGIVPQSRKWLARREGLFTGILVIAIVAGIAEWALSPVVGALAARLLG